MIAGRAAVMQDVPKSGAIVLIPRYGVVLAWLALLAPLSLANAEPEPTMRYRVVGVPSDDDLNVRSQPGVGADIVATLAPGSEGIAVTGVGQQVNGAAWWEILHDQAERGVGWVNARFLSMHSDSEPETGFALLCTGTEPFWSLELADGSAVYSSPQDDTVTWAASDWLNAAGLRPGQQFAVRLDEATQSATGWATIARPRQFCSDGMSEFEYPFDVTLIRPDHDIFAGCCRRAR